MSNNNQPSLAERAYTSRLHLNRVLSLIDTLETLRARVGAIVECAEAEKCAESAKFYGEMCGDICNLLEALRQLREDYRTHYSN